MTNFRRIIGVDPGTNILGFALIDAHKDNFKIIDIGVVKMKKSLSHHEKLKRIFESLNELIIAHRPETLAIEAPFYGKNIQVMLKLGRAQGMAIAAAVSQGLEIAEYAPRKIKQAVTGNGNAAKLQVAAMLNSIIKQPIKSDHLDATDALATAVCHHYQTSSLTNNQKRYEGWEGFINDHKERLK